MQHTVHIRIRGLEEVDTDPEDSEDDPDPPRPMPNSPAAPD